MILPPVPAPANLSLGEHRCWTALRQYGAAITRRVFNTVLPGTAAERLATGGLELARREEDIRMDAHHTRVVASRRDMTRARWQAQQYEEHSANSRRSLLDLLRRPNLLELILLPEAHLREVRGALERSAPVVTREPSTLPVGLVSCLPDGAMIRYSMAQDFPASAWANEDALKRCVQSLNRVLSAMSGMLGAALSLGLTTVDGVLELGGCFSFLVAPSLGDGVAYAPVVAPRVQCGNNGFVVVREVHVPPRL